MTGIRVICCFGSASIFNLDTLTKFPDNRVRAVTPLGFDAQLFQHGVAPVEPDFAFPQKHLQVRVEEVYFVKHAVGRGAQREHVSH